MTPLREAYLQAVELIGRPAVEMAWMKESALPRLSVGGLAEHRPAVPRPSLDGPRRAFKGCAIGCPPSPPTGWSIPRPGPGV